ncbi:conserved hypothetical protein [Hyphomicrobiales bacterium]|nr:conserved hypothetical protein [Hyphomicrobiales bacterium]CAH1698678.1 conserved hypothetical protein [Hyphomicrobiales bacterium]CAI0342324.1 conserved hypothetical protein [Hyphomicrobiales bacterium]
MSADLAELIGPYERWAHGTGAAYAFTGATVTDSPFIAATAEWPAGTDPYAIATGLKDSGSPGKKPAVLLPTLWPAAFDGPERVFCPVVLRVAEPRTDKAEDRLRDLAEACAQLRSGETEQRGKQETGIRFNSRIPRSALNPGFHPDNIAERYAACPFAPVPPAAMMAVIDDGIAFAHENVRGATGATRMEFCWLQGAAADGVAEPTVLFGREYLSDAIDELVQTHGHDEETLYRRASPDRGVYAGATIDRLATHGAHVLDAAAGHRYGGKHNPARPVPPAGNFDALRVIAVQLPAPATIETASFGKDAFILSAFHYIFDRADRVAERYLGKGAMLPLIINFSYGFNGGPHQGGERLERALRSLIRRRIARGGVTHLIMPAGNDFLSSLHGEITPDLLSGHDRGFDIPWRLQPNDRTSNYLEIWLPQGAIPDGVSITITDPKGHAIYDGSIDRAGSSIRHIDLMPPGSLCQHPIGQASVERYRTGDDRALWRFVMALAPTTPDNPTLPSTSSGTWTVRLGHLHGVARHGPITCRIQRDINPFGYALGARQSYFDDPGDEAFEASGHRPLGDNPAGVFVRRFGTLNGLATHDAVAVVGGFVADSRTPALYSAAGKYPTLPSGAGRVHVSAPADASSALEGVLAGGTRSGAVVRMSGTSMAAPQVARAAAIAYLTGTGPAQGPDPCNAGEEIMRLLEGRLHPAPQDPISQAKLGGALLASDG